jgi:hypothetical protein
MQVGYSTVIMRFVLGSIIKGIKRKQIFATGLASMR